MIKLESISIYCLLNMYYAQGNGIYSIEDRVMWTYSPDWQVASMYINISPFKKNEYNFIKMDSKTVKMCLELMESTFRSSNSTSWALLYLDKQKWLG